ncbi:MAG: dihydrofolate reductase [Pseudomonadota bacterium]
MAQRFSPEHPAVSLIWAMTRNGVIGANQGLPWRLPEDLRFFMMTTTAKPNVMGRKTFESMKAPLPRRPNIVITRQTDYRRDDVDIVPTLDAGLSRARELCAELGRDELMVIGGAEIYRQALPQADRLYVTFVDADVDGDTCFPEVPWDRFTEVWRRDFGLLPGHDYPYTTAMFEAMP